MQCTSYVPVYYHARDLNAGASVFSWYPFDSNNNCGEERGYNIAMPPNNIDQYLGYDKEVVKQMIQNHEATFRYQVQELHRLYRRQRELMDEMRVREVFAQNLSESIHSLSNARPEFSHTPSHARSWLVGDLSCNIQRASNFVAENSYNDVKFQLTSSKESMKQVLDLELSADMYYDDPGLQFKEGNLSEAPKKVPNFQRASDSDIGSVKKGDSTCLNLNSQKTNCFIDLNEPMLLESEPSSDPSEIYSNHMEIDLNSMPVSCFSETEIALENLQSVNKESCAYDHAMKNEKCVEDHPFVDNSIFLKTEIEIDLNTSIEDEHSPRLSSAVLHIKLEEDAELVGPISPENEECSPPRGTSEDLRVEIPLLSEQGDGEPSMELDTIAAQTLVTIFSFGVQEYDSRNSLYWFAEIVSSTGDDLENNTMKLEHAAAENGFGALTLKSEEDAFNLCHGKKEKEMGALFGKGRTRGRKQCKDLEGPFKRKTVRKSCAKPRKYSKLSSSADETKKPISSILKQPATRSKQGVLQSWGKIRKRQGGHRRRATKFLVSL